MSHTLWTLYEITLVALAVMLLRFGLRLPPSTGRILIRIGATGVLIETILWLLGVLG